MPTIKITDDRQGATFRTGINGRIFDLPLNTEVNVSDAMADHLRTVGCRFDEVDHDKRASSSKEGSGEGLVRAIGPHDVEFPGTAAKSADDSIGNGDQPGDVTTAGASVQYSDPDKALGDYIEDDAEVSNLRVAAERTASEKAPVAEKMGEGEGGTPKADPQPVEPTHKDVSKGKTSSKKSSRK